MAEKRKPFMVGGMRVMFGGTLAPVIVRAGWRFRVIYPDMAGLYDDADSHLLPKDSPWHTIAQRVLDKGGHMVEMVDDDEFATELVQRGRYRPPTDIKYLDPGPPLDCVANVDRQAVHEPKAFIHIGLGCHYPGPGDSGLHWVRHTFLTLPPRRPFGKRPIWEVTAIPYGGYFGFPANDYWWRKWVHIAGGKLVDEEVK